MPGSFNAQLYRRKKTKKAKIADADDMKPMNEDHDKFLIKCDS